MRLPRWVAGPSDRRLWVTCLLEALCPGNDQDPPRRHVGQPASLPTDRGGLFSRVHGLPTDHGGSLWRVDGLPTEGGGSFWRVHLLPANGGGLFSRVHLLPTEGGGSFWRVHLLPANGGGSFSRVHLLPTKGGGSFWRVPPKGSRTPEKVGDGQSLVGKVPALVGRARGKVRGVPLTFRRRRRVAAWGRGQPCLGPCLDGSPRVEARRWRCGGMVWRGRGGTGFVAVFRGFQRRRIQRESNA